MRCTSHPRARVISSLRIRRSRRGDGPRLVRGPRGHSCPRRGARDVLGKTGRRWRECAKSRGRDVGGSRTRKSPNQMAQRRCVPPHPTAFFRSNAAAFVQFESDALCAISAVCDRRGQKKTGKPPEKRAFQEYRGPPSVGRTRRPVWRIRALEIAEGIALESCHTSSVRVGPPNSSRRSLLPQQRRSDRKHGAWRALSTRKTPQPEPHRSEHDERD